MAKALIGHVGIGNDPRLVAEVRRLRLRVRDLEDEVARVRAANEVLTAPVVDAYGADFDSELREPALA